MLVPWTQYWGLLHLFYHSGIMYCVMHYNYCIVLFTSQNDTGCVLNCSSILAICSALCISSITVFIFCCSAIYTIVLPLYIIVSCLGGGKGRLHERRGWVRDEPRGAEEVWQDAVHKQPWSGGRRHGTLHVQSGWELTGLPLGHDIGVYCTYMCFVL